LRLEVAWGLGGARLGGSAGKNGLFFFLIDVFDFARNSGRFDGFLMRIFALNSNQTNKLKNMSKEA
jgi:hypothetical protein